MVTFWKRENPSQANSVGSPPNGGSPPDARGSTLETTALDELAGILRTWGQYSFDLDDVKADAITEQCERWRWHVLSAAPLDVAAPAPDASPSDLKQRNWPGLRAFVARTRRSEQTYVSRQVIGTRQVMGDFVQTLGEVLAEDKEEQTRVMSVIHHLRQTIEENAPVERLTQEAMRAITMISEIARDRDQRHQGLLADLTKKLQTLRGELDAAQREMELDCLTRLYNRKAFDIQLERVFELCKLSGQPACLLMVDADHFKRVNDEHGHQAGDVVLRRVADCCAQSFPRKSDFVARYGGEEIAVILQDTQVSTASQLAQRLLDAIRALVVAHEGTELRITVSIGLAEIKHHPTAGQWLRASDSALYAAKEAGRDRLAVFGSAS
jgi:diguanylate cyclase